MADFLTGYRKLPQRPQSVESDVASYVRDIEELLVFLLNPAPQFDKITMGGNIIMWDGNYIGMDADLFTSRVLFSDNSNTIYGDTGFGKLSPTEAVDVVGTVKATRLLIGGVG